MDQKLYNLMDRTIRITKASKIPVRRIARETGLGEPWLRGLLRGDYGDAGVKKIETLHKYITDINNERRELSA